MIVFLPKNEEDTIRDLHASQARIQALRVHLNTFQRINPLPPEILSLIFLNATDVSQSHFLGKRARIITSARQETAGAVILCACVPALETDSFADPAPALILYRRGC